LFEVWNEVSPTEVVWYEREGGVRYRNWGVLAVSAAEAAGMVGNDGLAAGGFALRRSSRSTIGGLEIARGPCDPVGMDVLRSTGLERPVRVLPVVYAGRVWLCRWVAVAGAHKSTSSHTQRGR
jgi:hypothetical protein